MFDRFTDRARQSIVAAQDEARRLMHPAIGTEHLLLGLLRDGASVGTRALVEVGVSTERLGQDVREAVPPGTEAPADHLPFTSGSTKVLERALLESVRWRHTYLGTEHILLGLIGEGEGVAAQVLARTGIHPDLVREAVAVLLEAAPVAPGSTGAVLISYRREEAPWTAGRIFDALVDRLDTVLMDAGPPADVLPRCETVLLLIDPGWSEPIDKTVRAELLQAFALGKRVVPVLVQGASMPDADHLPPGCGALADLEPFPLDHAGFRDQMVDLADRLRRVA